MAQVSSILDLKDILNDYAKEVNDDMYTVAKDIANEYTTKIQNASPVNKYTTKHKGRYRKGWKADVSKNLNSVEVVIYNKSDWQLTWLLENGHNIVNKHGQKVGHYKGNVHIAPVNDEAQRDYENKLIKRLGG